MRARRPLFGEQQQNRKSQRFFVEKHQNIRLPHPWRIGSTHCFQMT
jgi:hypothetical protein